jgi:hypothetical protein
LHFPRRINLYVQGQHQKISPIFVIMGVVSLHHGSHENLLCVSSVEECCCGSSELAYLFPPGTVREEEFGLYCALLFLPCHMMILMWALPMDLPPVPANLPQSTQAKDYPMHQMPAASVSPFFVLRIFTSAASISKIYFFIFVCHESPHIHCQSTIFFVS